MNNTKPTSIFRIVTSAVVLSIALLGSVVLTGCEVENPKEIRKDVAGEIIHSQQSMGWSTPIHTVIRDENGYVVRVYGFYGQRGDKVKIANAHLYQ